MISPSAGRIEFDHLDATHVRQRLDRRRREREIRDVIDLAALDRNLPCPGIRNDLKHHAIEKDLVLLEVVRIALQHDVTAARPFPEFERARCRPA